MGGGTANASTFLNGNGQYTEAGGGKILQVVSAETTTETDVASTTMTDTTLTGSITLTKASSKILVITNQRWSMDRQAAGCYAGIQLLRGSTVILAGSSYCQGFQDNSSSSWLGMRSRITSIKMDTPGAGTHTYKTQGTCGSTTADGANVTFQEDSEISSIYLIEVAT